MNTKYDKVWEAIITPGRLKIPLKTNFNPTWLLYTLSACLLTAMITTIIIKI